MQLNVLDLFSGLGGWSEAFVLSGYNVVTVDNDPRFNPTICANVLDVRLETLLNALGDVPDVILASPPCQAFSMGGKGSKAAWDRVASGQPKDTDPSLDEFRWHYDAPYPFWGPRKPNDDVAMTGCALVLRALEITRTLAPRYWWLENPRGGLRTMGFMEDVPGPVTVTYCQYGENRMKPTDLWGRWPDTWMPRPPCKNGDPCHVSAPRGSRTGTQSIQDPALRAKIPFELSQEICKAVEAAHGG